MPKKTKKVIVNKRSYIQTDKNILTQSDQEVKEYSILKNELRNRIEDDIRNKISTMKILLKIRDKKLFKIDGYKKFDDFIKDFKLAKTQTYEYLKLAYLIENGQLKEENLIADGIHETLLKMMKKKAIITKQNLLQPLRFQLKTQKAYDFYKENTRFTSFYLEWSFENKADEIERLRLEFEKKKKL